MNDAIHVLGLLPARGGSKGIKGKNLRPLLGKPLLSWAARSLVNANGIAQKICCTDDINIAEQARYCGLEVPWLRSSFLAKDETLVVEVVLHALQRLSEIKREKYTHVVLVQATSPTVTSEDIETALSIAVNNNADTVISGYDVGEKHPARMFKIDKSNSVEWIWGVDGVMVRRQALSPIYIRTGLVYVFKAEIVLSRRSLYGDKVMAYIVPEDRAVNIDTEKDFDIAENALRNMGFTDHLTL